MSGYVYGLRSRDAAYRARPARRGVVWSRLLGSVAATAGRALRAARVAAVHVPGVAGAGAVSFGAWLAWAPAGFIAAGLFLLMIDRRVPSQ